MVMARFPQTIFTTQRKFNDYSADDMRYGDICESFLKRELRLTHVSDIIDPYTLTRLTAFDNPRSRFAGAYGNRRRGEKVSVQECARLLFEEMQVTSLPLALIGHQKYLINKMLHHFQHFNGAPFRDPSLNVAYKRQIYNDNSRRSSKLAIEKVINDNINYESGGYPLKEINVFKDRIGRSIMPKFNSPVLDKINGLGITIHDVHATRIEILCLENNGRSWNAKLRYSAQDHFGLDVEDIRKLKFHQFHFFRIWFILQRYNKFGFRPFLTNLEAIIDVKGGVE
ncbi:DUF3289 family protein [Erwinia sp. 9145]|uniref:DUF3289 family protein n=1 Tax=Erwinia sp. 9145 TaxID=1500895 RepID=UPI00054FD0FD|nr:DUF3289 family protein [Erwinia sp. 9145]